MLQVPNGAYLQMLDPDLEVNEGLLQLTRDPVRVREDVARGFVTPRGAREDYGVVLDPATLALDKSASNDERGRRAAPLALIDRGPGFAEAESRWRAGVVPRLAAPTGRP
jgi:N-methylhydantoinase B